MVSPIQVDSSRYAVHQIVTVRGQGLQKKKALKPINLDSGALLDCGGWACLLWETPHTGVYANCVFALGLSRTAYLT